eukprot:gene13334-19173_t
MAGDFRQILPVIQRGTRSQIVGAALCNSPLWNHFTLLQLTENMRVQRLLAQGRDATAQAQFLSLLLEIGEGRIGNPMQVPADILLPGTDPRGLVNWVYGDLRNPAEHIHKAILTPKNSDVDKINDMVMNRLPGQARTYYRSDYVGDDDDAQLYVAMSRVGEASAVRVMLAHQTPNGSTGLPPPRDGWTTNVVCSEVFSHLPGAT